MLRNLTWKLGPRRSNLAKLGSFGSDWTTFLWDQLERSFFVRIFLFDWTNKKIPLPSWKTFMRWEEWIKWPKIDQSDTENWLLAEIPFFGPILSRISITYFILPARTIKITFNSVLNWYPRRSRETSFFTEFFQHFAAKVFCIYSAMKLVRIGILFTQFGSCQSGMTKGKTWHINRKNL